MKFKKDFLMDELGLPYNSSIIMRNRCVDHRRWLAVYELIFEHKGKFYRTKYDQGLTECQEDRAWDYEDEIECDEVEAYEKTIIDYR